ncbi:MAG TPA: hypothetical protein P5121_15370 [Caldilineaceae bacterium]|nr:hypothetical protein [Caldilineaceae bacterium]
MARRKQSRGTCLFCGQEMTKGGLTRHLQSCAKRTEAIDAAPQKGDKQETLYHLQVQDAWGGEYWLHLEMKGSATLEALDSYLRAIWLECCGHLSQFSIGGWSGNEIAKSRQIDQVFRPDVTLTHIYDFGTESVTLIKAITTREGKALSCHPIYLMARNDPPEAQCMLCDQPAEWLCLECVYEEEASGLLCDEHAEGHPHDNYGEPMPLVNSPRVGMCGYIGPAEPPY